MSDWEMEVNVPEEENAITVMLMDDDGREEPHQILGWQELEGREFAVLCPVNIEEGAEVGLVIMESANNSLQFVDDELITQQVFDAFMEAFGVEE
ncbi:MAG: DUF1292 domain-containing protein [Oscillospiraceae bacterium]|nr:DUF1292 domain-containing protein [Oscillospiraceae bacterium]